MTLISPHTGEPLESQRTLPPESEYQPSPGRCLLIRKIPEEMVGSIVKPEVAIQFEQAFETQCTVVAVGAPMSGGMAPWFKRGDVVDAEPAFMQRSRRIAGNFEVFNVPYSAVLGVYVVAETNEPVPSEPTET